MAQPPMPTSQKVLRSPKDVQVRGKNKTMALTVVVGQPQVQVIIGPKPQLIALAADFQTLVQTNFTTIKGTAVIIGQTVACVSTNMQAFIDAKDSLTNEWVRQSLPYYTNGGTMAVPWTNKTGMVYFRAGFQFPE